jgi:hypothetical protein
MLTSFYDQLSPYYEYIFEDWNASVVGFKTVIILKDRFYQPLLIGLKV